MDFDREWYRERATRMTVVAHIFGILALILMLVWLLHYRGGLDLDSDNPYRILNVSQYFLLYFLRSFIIAMLLDVHHY